MDSQFWGALSPSQLAVCYRQLVTTLTLNVGFGAQTIICGLDPNRVLLDIRMSWGPGNRVQPVIPGFVQLGYTPPSGSNLLHFTYAEYGAIVGLPWLAISDTSEECTCIMQSFDPTLLAMARPYVADRPYQTVKDARAELERQRFALKRQKELRQLLTPFRRS